MTKAIYEFFAGVCLSISFCTSDWGFYLTKKVLVRVSVRILKRRCKLAKTVRFEVKENRPTTLGDFVNISINHVLHVFF
jgi:hypothetical protein